MLRNAGTRVKLLIARDGPKDNHCSSPVFNQQNLDGVVGVCVPVEEKGWEGRGIKNITV